MEKKVNFKNLNVFSIGNYALIKKQLKILKIKIKLKKIDKIEKQNFKKELLIFDMPINLKNLLILIKIIKANYLINC